MSSQEQILVIEDSRFFQNLIEKVFEDDKGIRLTFASSFEAAEETLRDGMFSLALVDLNLPDAHEGEAVDLTIEKGIPTVVFTSNFEETTRTKFLDKGVLDFVLKDNPSSIDYLQKLAKRIVRNRETTALVVDDSSVARRFCAELLERYQLNVVEADSGEAALKVLESRDDIRLMITDNQMPGMNGFDLVTTVRRSHRRDSMAIIGVSSSGGAPLSAKFLKHGANDFIAKPYLPEELYTRVALNLDMLDNIDALTDAATKDFLTGLYNRRSFFDMGRRIVSTRKRSKNFCAVSIMDIDYFKKVNDTYGHDAGDDVLRAVANTLLNLTHRGGDICARLGGEEFAILLEMDEPKHAKGFFEKLRAAVEELAVESGEHTIRVTASFGVMISTEPELEAMISAADSNLYKAKEAGRNRVEIGQD